MDTCKHKRIQGLLRRRIFSGDNSRDWAGSLKENLSVLLDDFFTGWMPDIALIFDTKGQVAGCAPYQLPVCLVFALLKSSCRSPKIIPNLYSKACKVSSYFAATKSAII